MRLRTIRDRLEERFIKPLVIERLCALVGPAMEEAEEDEGSPTFTLFERALSEVAADAVGVGLDVPNWLEQLESEVGRIRASKSRLSVMAEETMRIPRREMALADFQRQLAELDKSLGGE